MRVPVAVSVLVDRSGHATRVSWIKVENGELQLTPPTHSGR